MPDTKAPILVEPWLVGRDHACFERGQCLWTVAERYAMRAF
jgi:hypothetical protein